MAAEQTQLYTGNPQRYDELLDRDGSPRPHWRALLAHLSNGGADSARRSVELARRLIIENGVTYNVYADAQGAERPWQLDPLPLLLNAAEWREIEAGVCQRAQLLNALLADLYGPQRLLNDGLVPAELAFGHPNFLWAAHGIRPRSGTWLHLLAVDLARSPEGRWWVLGERTQTPSGPGYALENRHITARVLPGLVSELGVRPLDGFFDALRENLMSQVEDSAGGLAVVLTPGPFNETYFEHAFLARQLGMPLVLGTDLTVRADTVYLKTLSGLKRVHTIFRRLDDDFCDPLELRGDSALGVPGMLGVVRTGRVVLANALGSGVLESAAWLGFLPGAASRLLAEPLRLNSLATWWCGERPALEYAIAHLEHLVFKPTFPNQKYEATFGRDLDGEQRAALIARLRSRPYAYVAQERIAMSQAPVWRSGASMQLAPRALTLRVYAIATAQGYRVMPGGLARIAAEGVTDIVSSQRGGGSKDVWVLADGGTAAETAPSPRLARHDELPSQLVENLYWLGRYSERCEDKARLLRATLSMRNHPAVWAAACDTCIDYGVIEAEREPVESLYDDASPFGLSADLRRLGWCATQSRSRLSAEHWRLISIMQQGFRQAGAAGADAVESLDALLVSLTALSGFALDDMTQDEGWYLLMLGRRLERVQFLAGLISGMLLGGRAHFQGELDWLLDVGSASITYRTRYVATPRLSPVLQLLIFDQTSPRALAFQWLAVRRALADLGDTLVALSDGQFELAIERLVALGVQGVDDELNGEDRWRQLAAALSGLAEAAGHLSDRLTTRHFSHLDLDVCLVAT